MCGIRSVVTTYSPRSSQPSCSPIRASARPSRRITPSCSMRNGGRQCSGARPAMPRWKSCPTPMTCASSCRRTAGLRSSEARMYLSALDLFTIGLGPSSAQTVGPMRAARRFVHALAADGKLSFTTTVIADLFGSLALGGRDQGSDTAVILGLSGIDPENVDGDEASAAVARIRTGKVIRLEGQHAIRFEEVEHVRLRV